MYDEFPGSSNGRKYPGEGDDSTINDEDEGVEDGVSDGRNEIAAAGADARALADETADAPEKAGGKLVEKKFLKTNYFETWRTCNLPPQGAR